MFCLVYASSAARPFSPSELTDLLASCHANNRQLGITGMLLYKNGNFMQVLEGDEEAVLKLYAKIFQDERHSGVLTLLQTTIPARQFPDWSMGFRDLNSPEVRSLPVYNEFLNRPLTGAEFSADPTYCQRLLTIFKKMM